MGWTTPRDWTAGEIVTAAIMNTHIRDNERYLKGLDGTVTLSDGLDLGANELTVNSLETVGVDGIVNKEQVEDHTHQDTANCGTLDHGLALTGLTDDDHTQYQKESLLTTAGDMVYATAASTWARLGIGTANQILKTNAGATAPEWAAPQLIGSHAWKAANETVNNSSVLQNDDALLFAVGTTDEWAFEFVLFYISGATPDIKFAITTPANSTLIWSIPSAFYDSTGNVAAPSVITVSGTALAAVGTGANTSIMIKGYVKTTDTAGNITLQWAQDTTNISDTTVLAGSYLTAFQLS